MNIIILGAGQVGSNVARSLTTEDDDITVVDLRVDLLQILQDELDIRTVVGSASSPRVLEEAGGRDADLIIAVTSSDETNMTACQVAHSLFHTATLIARVRNADFLRYPELFGRDAIPVDVVISPEQVVTSYLRGLIEYPVSLQIHEFSGNRVVVVGLRARAGGRLVDQPVSALARDLPDIATRILALYREDKSVALDADTFVRPDDELFIVVARSDIRALVTAFREKERRDRRILIAGGGNIGKALAQSLESERHVKIIEFDRDRANLLAELLDHTVVLHGDATDKALLLDEDIDQTDVFCALTNDDEDNIMAALLAKHLGSRRVIALINRASYVELMENNSAIDVVVSPEQVTMGAILPHVRKGDVVRAYPLRGGQAEALEAVAHGDLKTSQMVGRRVQDLRLPSGATVAAVVRGNEVLIHNDDVVIAPEDHLILFLTDKTHLRDVERMLQVSAQFL